MGVWIQIPTIVGLNLYISDNKDWLDFELSRGWKLEKIKSLFNKYLNCC